MEDKKQYHMYTDEEKLKIIKEHDDNKLSIRACSLKYGLSKTSLVMWLRSYRKGGIKGLQNLKQQ
ncbi:MAG: helix-turn-helix domain-containing protein [Bacteroidaceae bacterium]